MRTQLAALLLLLAFSAALGVAVARGGVRNARAAAAGYGETEVVGSEYPKTLRSRTSSAVLPVRPRRIASLTVTADELVTRLAAPYDIVAVTRFADDPVIERGAGRAPTSAARVRGVDPERVVALEPDLVFVAHYTLESAVRILGAARIPVVRLRNTRTFDDVVANTLTVARAVGDEPAGALVVQKMREEIRDVAARVAGKKRPRVLYYSSVGYTSGSGTLVHEKILAAGGDNVAATAGLVGSRNVSLDLLAGLDPEIIVVPCWSADREGPVRDVMTSVAFRDVAAVRKGRVLAFPASALTSESPDGIAGVRELASRLHPEAFP